MKRLFKLTLAIALIGTSTSCSDYLDKEPLDQISDATLWESQALASLYVDEIYAEMLFMTSETVNTDRNNTHYGALLNLAMMSDEGRATESGSAVLNTYARGLLTVSGGFQNMWPLYTTIRSTNELFEKIEDSSMDAADKQELIDRARYARALCYFTLVKYYGAVPLITYAQAIDAPYDELYVSRTPEQDVYDFIISECSDIFATMPDSASAGYPSKWAAKALESRAALYAGSIAKYGEVQLDGLLGIPSSDANTYFETSYKASKSIIEDSSHALYNKYPEDPATNFRQLFLDESSNPEPIMVVAYEGTAAVGINYAFAFFSLPYPFTAAWGGTKVSVYLDLIETFDYVDGSSGEIDEKFFTGLHHPSEIFANKDPRFFATIMTQSSEWFEQQAEMYTYYIDEDGTEIFGTTNVSYTGKNGDTVAVATLGAAQNVTNTPKTGFTPCKYAGDISYIPNNWYGEADWHVFRTGEIYLNYAEAAYELGYTSEALAKVNDIRDRAGVAGHASIDMDKIRDERRVELAFESHRWLDLRRWRTAEDALTYSSGKHRGLAYKLDYNSVLAADGDLSQYKYKIDIIEQVDDNTTKYFDPKMYYLPITTTNTTNNPNLVENPGY